MALEVGVPVLVEHPTSSKVLKMFQDDLDLLQAVGKDVESGEVCSTHQWSPISSSSLVQHSLLYPDRRFVSLEVGGSTCLSAVTSISAATNLLSEGLISYEAAQRVAELSLRVVDHLGFREDDDLLSYRRALSSDLEKLNRVLSVNGGKETRSRQRVLKRQSCVRVSRVERRMMALVSDKGKPHIMQSSEVAKTNEQSPSNKPQATLEDEFRAIRNFSFLPEA